MKTVAFGAGGKALTRGVLELLGWQMLQGPSLSACHRVSSPADWCCDLRPMFPDPPCLGCKSLKAGIVSQAVLSHCPSLVSAGSAWDGLGCSWLPVSCASVKPSVHPTHRRTAVDTDGLYNIFISVCHLQSRSVFEGTATPFLLVCCSQLR